MTQPIRRIINHKHLIMITRSTRPVHIPIFQPNIGVSYRHKCVNLLPEHQFQRSCIIQFNHPLFDGRHAYFVDQLRRFDKHLQSIMNAPRYLRPQLRSDIIDRPLPIIKGQRASQPSNNKYLGKKREYQYPSQGKSF